VPYPTGDLLFVEDWTYQGGFANEIAICGYYDPKTRDAGDAACEALALAHDVPEGARLQARHNLQWYAKPLRWLCPSLKTSKVMAEPPPDHRWMNPSVCMWGDEIRIVLRAVNYTIRPDGSYIMPEHEPAIVTRNFIATLDGNMQPVGIQALVPNPPLPEPNYLPVRGLEDVRIIAVDNELRFVATVREMADDGRAQQMTGWIESSGIVDWRILAPDAVRHEKNWMPINRGGKLEFLYQCGPVTRVLDAEAQAIIERGTFGIACENFRGGSQVIPFAEGWLAVIHEVDAMPGAGERSYQHRFVWFDENFTLTEMSERFYLNARGIEFVAGLCWHPNGSHLVMSYGAARDSEAWVATMDADDVSAMLRRPRPLSWWLQSYL